MDYELIYDASKQLYSGGGFTLLILTGVSFLAWIMTLVKNHIFHNSLFLVMYSNFCIAFFVFLIFLITIGFFLNFKKTYSASKSNSCRVLEGVVEGFETKPHARGVERFKVNDVAFKYSSNKISGGFNKIAFNGGPMSQGRRVRICFIQGDRPKNNLIVRLEVESN